MPSEYEEFLEDFGARAHTDRDLSRLLEHAQNDGDLRRLVNEYRTLRRLVRDWLLPKIDQSSVPMSETERNLIDLARSIVKEDDSGSAA